MKAEPGLNERVRWVLIENLERKHISDSRMASVLGCSEEYIRDCKDLRTQLNGDFISSLIEVYNLRVEWIYANEGEPYESESDPDNPGEFPDLAVRKELRELYARHSDTLYKAVAIMETGGMAAVYLLSLIEVVDHNRATSMENDQMRKEIEDLREEVESLRAKGGGPRSEDEGRNGSVGAD